MNELKVVPKAGFDYHAKVSIMAFDKNAFVQRTGDGFYVKTSTSEEEIKRFTTVKSVTNMNSAAKELPLSIQRIHEFVNLTMMDYPGINDYTRVTEVDLDGVYDDQGRPLKDIRKWTRKYPRAVAGLGRIDSPFLDIKFVDDASGFRLLYRSSRQIKSFPNPGQYRD